MTYDYLLKLIKVSYAKDTKGVSKASRSSVSVLCKKKSVSTSVFNAARQEGKRPAYVFTVNKYEYDGQQEVEFEGKKYLVTRTYEVGAEEVELTVEEVIGV